MKAMPRIRDLTRANGLTIAAIHACKQRRYFHDPTQGSTRGMRTPRMLFDGRLAAVKQRASKIFEQQKF